MPKDKSKNSAEDEDAKMPTPTHTHNDEDILSSSESSSDDDSLVLEGVLVRNPDVSSSSDDSDDEEDAKKPATETGDKTSKTNDKNKAMTTAANAKRPASDTAKEAAPKKKKKSKPSNKEPEIDMVHVDFIFCDMDPKYWDGLRGLLSNAGSALYQAHASAVADAVIEYDMVGTCLGQPDDPEHTVYGFASLLHWAHFPDTARQAFAKVCQYNPQTPDKRSTTARSRLVDSLQTCFDKHTSKVAFLLSGRMMNLPVEIVLSLHQQLWLDIQWAQSEQTKLSYRDIDQVVRLAPCTRDDDNDGTSYAYRYFDDEFLAQQAKTSYVVQGPTSFSREDVLYIHVLILDLPGYQRAIQAMERMVNGSNTGGHASNSSGGGGGGGNETMDKGKSKNGGGGGGKQKKKKGKR